MTNSTNRNLTEEDYLKMHIQNLENKSVQSVNTKREFDEFRDDSNNQKVGDLKFFSFDVKHFPCGIFYPKGTTIQIRPADVKEIQAYSMVDDSNYYDMIEKMNNMISSCVRIKYVDGRVASYLDIKDGDRFFIIFLIRELTFQNSNSLAVKAKCTCGQEVDIEYKKENFRFHQLEERQKKYFDYINGYFKYNLINGKTYELAPPTFGLQKSFTQYLVSLPDKDLVNLSFLKIVPFLLVNKTSITNEGISKKLEEYEKIDDESFQFLNNVVSKLNFGIEKLSKICSCGLEVHSQFMFPNGPSGLFIVQDAFDKYIRD